MEKLLTIVTTMLPLPIPEHLPLLMGIDGPGGAGKSIFAAALARRLQQERVSVTIVRMDDFFSRPPSGQQDAAPTSRSVVILTGNDCAIRFSSRWCTIKKITTSPRSARISRPTFT